MDTMTIEAKMNKIEQALRNGAKIVVFESGYDEPCINTAISQGIRAYKLPVYEDRTAVLSGEPLNMAHANIRSSIREDNSEKIADGLYIVRQPDCFIIHTLAEYNDTVGHCQTIVDYERMTGRTAVLKGKARQERGKMGK